MGNWRSKIWMVEPSRSQTEVCSARSWEHQLSIHLSQQFLVCTRSTTGQWQSMDRYLTWFYMNYQFLLEKKQNFENQARWFVWMKNDPVRFETENHWIGTPLHHQLSTGSSTKPYQSYKTLLESFLIHPNYLGWFSKSCFFSSENWWFI